MGEAKRRREEGFVGEKRHPPKTFRGRKGKIAHGAHRTLPPIGERISVEGLVYFRDVHGNLRKITPKLERELKGRMKRIEENLEQEYQERKEAQSTQEEN